MRCIEKWGIETFLDFHSGGSEVPIPTENDLWREFDVLRQSYLSPMVWRTEYYWRILDDHIGLANILGKIYEKPSLMTDGRWAWANISRE